MTPQDDVARIQALIEEFTQFALSSDGKDELRDMCGQLVQVATAAAYRHAAAYCRESGKHTDFVTEHMALTKVAQFLEGWAEKAEAGDASQVER